MRKLLSWGALSRRGFVLFNTPYTRGLEMNLFHVLFLNHFYLSLKQALLKLPSLSFTYSCQFPISWCLPTWLAILPSTSVHVIILEVIHFHIHDSFSTSTSLDPTIFFSTPPQKPLTFFTIDFVINNICATFKTSVSNTHAFSITV